MDPFDSKRLRATAQVARHPRKHSALALALALALAGSALPAAARDPDGILDVERVKLARRGDSGLFTGSALVANPTSDPVIDLWNKLYSRTSLGPLRDASLTIRFPNSGGCGNCANPNGTVWISADRAANHRTIYHELGHQLMYEYWDDQLPPNSGGPHNWDDCYTGGLAMSEGFAHFVSCWARVDRHDMTPTFPGGWNVESLPNTVCQDDSENELWAAATFWDLHDSRGADDDALGFPDEDTLRVFLEAGLTNDMSELREKVREDKEDQGWFVLASIDDIFTQNHTFDPPSP